MQSRPCCDPVQVFGGNKGKTRRVHNLQADVAALEAALGAAKAEYDRVLDRNLKVRCGCPIKIKLFTLAPLQRNP